MPNIEIHGVLDPDRMEDSIFKLFEDEKYADDMVVSIHDTKVVDRHGNGQPYLRLVNSCQDHTPAIIEKLKTLNIDIEFLPLQGFIPKAVPGN